MNLMTIFQRYPDQEGDYIPKSHFLLTSDPAMLIL